MVQTSSNDETNCFPSKPGREVTLVFLLQLVLIVALVQSDRLFQFGGNLTALVGVVFILLPVMILDRSGRPYKRYGIHWGKPGFDALWALGAMAVTLPLTALIAPIVWRNLGIFELDPWSFALPRNYPMMAITHAVVIAFPEEFFYRGYLMGRLDDIFKKRINLLGAQVGWALVIQAVLFGLGHFLVELNPGRLMVFFPALAFGWLRAKRGCIGPGIVYHAACNIFMDFLLAGFGRS